MKDLMGVASSLILETGALKESETRKSYRERIFRMMTELSAIHAELHDVRREIRGQYNNEHEKKPVRIPVDDRSSGNTDPNSMIYRDKKGNPIEQNKPPAGVDIHGNLVEGE